jgi:hypothetical protein
MTGSQSLKKFLTIHAELHMVQHVEVAVGIALPVEKS